MEQMKLSLAKYFRTGIQLMLAANGYRGSLDDHIGCNIRDIVRSVVDAKLIPQRRIRHLLPWAQMTCRERACPR